MYHSVLIVEFPSKYWTGELRLASLWFCSSASANGTALLHCQVVLAFINRLLLCIGERSFIELLFAVIVEIN